MLDKIPKFICVSMVIIVLVQVIGTIVVYLANRNQENQVVAAQIIENYSTGNLLTSGLSIIAIAVSVWVGINVYISLSREEVFDLKKDVAGLRDSIDSAILKLNIKIDVQNDAFMRLEMQHLINQLETLHYQYELSGYFAFLFRMISIDQDIEFIHSLIQCEDEYIFWTKQYEAERYEDCYNGCKELFKRFSEIKEDYQMVVDNRENGANFSDKVIMLYLENRVAEMLYYPNACCLRINGYEEYFDMGSMEKVVCSYETLIDKMKMDFPHYPEHNIVLAYICNTIGYSLDLMNQIDRNEIRSEEASQYTQMAVESLGDKESNKRARYLRNKGLTAERIGKREEAEELYRKSIKTDPTDEKSWNNLATLILKELEEKCNIFKRDVTLNHMESSLFEQWIPELKKAKSMYELAISIEPSFVDPYHKLIQVYTYLYLANPDRNGKIAGAEKYINLLNTREYRNMGYLFAYRNYYEAIGDIENAVLVNNDIRETTGNDVAHMKTLYNKEKGKES